jgi:hypothetical protein
MPAFATGSIGSVASCTCIADALSGDYQGKRHRCRVCGAVTFDRPPEFSEECWSVLGPWRTASTEARAVPTVTGGRTGRSARVRLGLSGASRASGPECGFEGRVGAVGQQMGSNRCP